MAEDGESGAGTLRRMRGVRVLVAVAVTVATTVAVAVLPAGPAAADQPLRLDQIENAATGQCLDILDRGDVNGSPAIQNNCAWSLLFDEEYGVGTWPNEYLVIRGEVPKCLEVENFSTANYASVAQHDCNGGPHQQWRFVPSGITGTTAYARWLSGSWTIRNAYSGKCLDVLNTRVVQNDCSGGVNQLWFVSWVYV